MQQKKAATGKIAFLAFLALPLVAGGAPWDECRVDRRAMPDRAWLRQAAEDRKAAQALALRIGQEREDALARAAAPRPPSPAPSTPAPGTAGMLAGGGGIAAAPTSRTLTFQQGGREYTAQVLPTIPKDQAIAMLKQQQAQEDRIGPERQPLLLAVGAGDAAHVSKLLRAGADPNQVIDRRGQPVGIVFHAVSTWLGGPEAAVPQTRTVQDPQRFLAIVRLLVEAGAKPATFDFQERRALAQLAAHRGAHGEQAAEMAAYLLAHGASLQGPVAPYPSDLELAIDSGNQAMLPALLRHGRATQRQLDAALMHATSRWQLTATLQVLAAGANPKIAPNLPSMLASTRSVALWEAVRQRGIDLDAPVQGGKPMLLSFIHHHDWMERLLAAGAKPNAANGLAGGNPPVASALHGATATDPSLAYWFGTRMLDPAVRARSVELLLRAGANPNLRSADGLTPLMQTSPDDAPAIRLLLAAGGRVVPSTPPQAQPGRQPTSIGPVSWALSQGNDTLATALVNAATASDRADCGAAYYAARTGATATLAALLDKDLAGKNISEDGGETPLIGAAAAGHLETVRMLLERKAANANEATSPRIALDLLLHGSRGYPPKGTTALMAAAQAGHADVVKLLLVHGAQVDQRNAEGLDAMRYASHARNSAEIQGLLLAAGARRR